MSFKIFVLLASCIAVSQAGIIPSSAQPEVLQKSDESDHQPHYTFGYQIQDEVSGDSKNQYETRDGDLVRGQYSLIDADGFRRIVDYTASSAAAAAKENPISPLGRSVQTQVAFGASRSSLPSTQNSALVNAAGNAIVKTTFTSPISSYTY